MVFVPVTINNHKAGRDYYILETIEAGIALKGTEVKSLRAARASIDDAFARIEKGEVWLYNCHIHHYEQGNRWNVDPLRPRRLLLHKKEIIRLASRTQAKGMALIPLKIYFPKRYAKVLLAVARGKTQVDKREAIKRKTHEREIRRALANRMKHRRT
ncbi:MAG: SsrA-binding protein SmpB [Verrucomicrobiae bacterium]|nr:SsrA-binding protein SmpB [Verrucomicrobiae bacterium]